MEDSQILEKFKNPDTRNYAFNLLVRKYQERVYWHIRKMVLSHEDADDLTQEVFLKVYSSLDGFRGDSQLFTWIYRIASNYSLNYLKKEKRRSFFSLSNYTEVLENTLVQECNLSGEEISFKLQKALLQLPEKQRLVFNMKYFDDMKYEEIVEVTGGTVGSLKASYHHAVKKIENLLSAD